MLNDIIGAFLTIVLSVALGVSVDCIIQEIQAEIILRRKYAGRASRP